MCFCFYKHHTRNSMGIKSQKDARCKRCQIELVGESIKAGFCDACVLKEISELKKRIIQSSIIGIALMLIAVGIRNYCCSVGYVGRHEEIIIPILGLNLMFKESSFRKLFYPSTIRAMVILLICFLAPFGSWVQIEYNTYRHKAEQDLYKVDPFAGRMAVDSNNQRNDDVGLFIFSVIFSALSGPYFFVYRLFKLKQLENYLSKNKIRHNR